MIVRGLENLQPMRDPCAVSIGNFDGVHIGHQAIISQLLRISEQAQLTARVVSFEPQPKEYFLGQRAPTRLTSARQKYELISAAGVDQLLLLRFNRQLAELTALQFIEQILIERLNVKALLVGDDFRFGAGRAGDYSILEKFSSDYDYVVHRTQSVLVDGERVSSTLLRDALAGADLQRARRMMGREYSIAGRVLHGDKRGRSWGFPTANLLIKSQRPALTGVFAVEVVGLEKRPLQGVANLGVRPTVDGTRALLETHIFNFDREIYGDRITVVFKHKLRDEQKFDSFEQLKQQIALDCEQAHEYFNNNTDKQ